jgi:hypothetical protein
MGVSSSHFLVAPAAALTGRFPAGQAGPAHGATVKLRPQRGKIAAGAGFQVPVNFWAMARP